MSKINYNQDLLDEPVCPRCGGEEYYNQDDLYYCCECNTLMEIAPIKEQKQKIKVKKFKEWRN